MYFLFLAPLMQCTNFLYLTENVRLIKAAKLNCKKKKKHSCWNDWYQHQVSFNRVQRNSFKKHVCGLEQENK